MNPKDPKFVLGVHLFVGLGLALFGLLLLANGSLPGAGVNIVLGTIVVGVGYRVSRSL